MKKPGSGLIIREMQPGEAMEVSSLISEVFHKFVAPYLLPEGVEHFVTHTNAHSMQVRLGGDHLILLAELDGELAGVADIRGHKHLSLFFVKTSLHGKGVGHRLLDEVIRRCLAKHPDLAALTVNSSIWAVPVYKKLGFVQTQAEQLKDGISFVPMQKTLNEASTGEPKMQFRPIELADIPAIFRVRIATWDSDTPEEDLTSLGITHESVAQMLESGSHQGWLCEMDGEVVAFSMGNRETGELWVISVLEEHEGKGIGKKLMELTEEWLWSQDWSEIWLSTYLDPEVRAVGFYRHLGWDDWKIDEDRYMKKSNPRGKTD